MYEELVENKDLGESIFMEVASNMANLVLQQLNDLRAELPLDIFWAIHSRSRGSSPDHKMYTIVGSMHSHVDMHTLGMVNAIKTKYQGDKMFIGRRKTFADTRAIIATGPERP